MAEAAVDLSSSFSLDEQKYVLVAAIDFGTTYSGYASSFKGKEEEIKMNKNWGDGQGFQTYKVPTSILVDDDGDFVAFGFDAEEKYSQQQEQSQESNESDDLDSFELDTEKKCSQKEQSMESSESDDLDAFEYDTKIKCNYSRKEQSHWLDDDDDLFAFCSDAEEKFSQEENSKGYHLYRHFKMILHNKEVKYFNVNKTMFTSTEQTFTIVNEPIFHKTE